MFSSKRLMTNGMRNSCVYVRNNVCIDNLATGTVLQESTTDSSQETTETCSPPENGVNFFDDIDIKSVSK